MYSFFFYQNILGQINCATKAITKCHIEEDSLLIGHDTPTIKENYCDGYFMVAPGVLRLNVMSECVCECFWMRLAFELVDGVK